MMRSRNDNNLISRKQLLNRIVDIKVNEDGTFDVSKCPYTAAILHIGGISIFTFNESDKNSCYQNLARATGLINTPHKYIIASTPPVLTEQRQYFEYKISNTVHSFQKSLLRKELEHLDNLEAQPVRDTYLVIYAKDKTELNNLCSIYISNMPDVPVTRLQDKAEVTSLLRRLMTFDTKNSSSIIPDKLQLFQSHICINDSCYVAKLTATAYPDSILDLQYAAFAFDGDFADCVLIIDVVPSQRSETLSSLSKSLQELTSRTEINQTYAATLNDSTELSQLRRLYENISSGEEQILSHSLSFYVSSSSKEQLLERCEYITQQIESLSIGLTAPHYCMADAYRSLIVPDNTADIAIPLYDTFARQYPFYSQNLSDIHGVNAGYTSSGGMWLLDIFNRTPLRPSFDMCITGGMGSGKSVFLKDYASKLVALGHIVFIVDVEGEFTKLAEVLGGKVITMSQSSCINPLQIYATGDKSIESDHSDYAAGLNLIVQFFNLVNRGMESHDKNVLAEMLNEMYYSFGINHSTDFAAKQPDEFPTLQHLLATIIKNKKSDKIIDEKRKVLDRLESMIKMLAEQPAFAKTSTISVQDNSFIVFNVKNYERSELLEPLVFNIINLAWTVSVSNASYNASITNRNDKRCIAVIYDEAHKYLGEDHIFLVNEILDRLRRNRKYNTANIFATQALSDFISTTATEASKKVSTLFELCTYKIIMKQKSPELIRKTFSEFTDSEIKQVQSFKPGDLLFSFSDDREKMMCHKTVSDIALLYLGTSGDELQLAEKWCEEFNGKQYLSSPKEFCVSIAKQVLDKYDISVSDSPELVTLLYGALNKVYLSMSGGASENG